MAKLATDLRCTQPLFHMTVSDSAQAIGERRLIGYTGVGISLCEELDIAATHKSAGAGDEDKEAQQKV